MDNKTNTHGSRLLNKSQASTLWPFCFLKAYDLSSFLVLIWQKKKKLREMMHYLSLLKI